MLKKFYFSICAVAGLLIGFNSCDSDKDFDNAIVVDTADSGKINCGYLLKLDDGSLIKPNNLGTNYHQDGLTVKVKYSFTGVKDTCNYDPKIYDLVLITDIKKEVR